jgi:probable F420-dependent oxidoreductase
MRFGVQLYPWARWPDLASIATVTRSAESLGFSAVVLSEHLVTPLTGDEAPIGRVWPEIYVLSAFLAGQTETIRFVYNATVVPYRHPIHQANEIATLDQVSGGRLTIVTGIGWLQGEFAALGVPFANRGARTDEYIRAMRVLWTEDEPEFHGKYVDFDKVALEPKCMQRPHIPILIGGVGAHARRRIVEFGDGWGAPIPWPMDRLTREISRINEAVASAGRSPEALQFSAGLSFGTPDATAAKAFAHVGSLGTMPGAPSAEETLDVIGRYHDAGVTDLIVSTDWSTPADYSDKLAWFSEHVIART